MDHKKLIQDTYNQIADLYTDRYFDISSDTDLVDRFLKQLPAQAKILDIGCGPGNFTQYLVSKGFQVEGIDIAAEMLRVARTHLPQVTFTQGDLSALPYPDQSFDAVFSAYSLIHVAQADIAKTIIGLQRILTSKGLVFVLVQKGTSDHLIAEPLMPERQNFVNFFSLDNLVQDFQTNGFTVKEHIEIPINDPDNLTDSILFLIAQKTN